uniref:VWFA domain-containing protein n=1 Tax=Rhizochromulina marina TaxID=1034831 RepID=A0A7S2SEF9_9STRA|mmetsp:Transcript_28985/g.84603  ORF Transcript_28985/g.84603 Transcript_28985/m.84603 type:complete len:371 (+) Transcript_28985:170-1282(+)
MDGRNRWEGDLSRTWESLKEDEEGRLGVVGRRQQSRAGQEQEAAVRRNMIRYLYLVVDMSHSMGMRDFRPSRAGATQQLLKDFATRFFTQNPLSNLGVICTHDGVAEKLTDLSGNPRAHAEALSQKFTTSGEASLQNALEVACSLLKGIPDYGNREVLVVFSSLTSRDPADIFATIDKLRKHKIRVSVIHLAAEVHVMRSLVDKTGGSFGVARDFQHVKSLLMEHLVPPATPPQTDPDAEMVLMGFPSRIQQADAVLGYDSGAPAFLSVAFECPRCGTRTSELPSTCVVCTLPLISSPHLAQSYHHLSPLGVFHTSDEETASPCAGCGVDGPSERVVCGKCRGKFCLDCERFLQESLHNCPRCLELAGQC